MPILTGDETMNTTTQAEPRTTVLVIGATGSIGRHVVAEALRVGYHTRALVRDAQKARTLPSQAERMVGDVTQPETLKSALDGVDAIVFTHGSEGNGAAGAESVDYGAVHNTLSALGSRKVRIALMTAIGVTNRTSAYNRSYEVHDWKRRAERLVRASGLPYTIVRPGWFDYNDADQHRLVLLQGDRRHAGSPADGVVARSQIAQILVNSLSSDAADRKTFELVAERGPAQQDFESLFGALETDPATALDAVHDTPNMPLNQEPARVRDDLRRVNASIRA
jgi:uncharacterized protein YbjT (DUF2867 family)